MSAELRRVELVKSVAEVLDVHPLALAANLEVPTVKEYMPEVLASRDPGHEAFLHELLEAGRNILR